MAIAGSLQNFIVAALKEDQRVDGRRPFDSRRLQIKFSRQDGAAEVQLGQTLVMCNVSCQLVQPFPDRPNEGSLSVFIEFSPMADPSFEIGRQGESAVELGRVIDRSLRESRAVDTESLCVLAGKAVWSLRIDISVLDNGGNLIDAASVAALAALLSFRRPECSAGGGEGQEVIVHPPEIREPLPLILHHLPIAVTFALFEDGDLVVMDPSYKEELVMKGRLTITMNVHGDICAIQKGGGVGVSYSEIMRCLRIAATKVADITSMLKKAAEAHETERAFRKVKRHTIASATGDMKVDVDKSKPDIEMRDAMLERAIKPKIELTDDDEDSSSDDDSDSEEEAVALDKVVAKRELTNDARTALQVEHLFQGGVTKWDEDSKPSTASSARLSAVGEVAVRSSHVGQDGGQDESSHTLVNTVKKNRRWKKKKKN